jgi:fatty-acyl-CoA synthase
MALALALRSTIVVRRRFDARQTLSAVDEHRCSTLVLVPTMLQRILELGSGELRRHSFPALRILFCSGSALPPSVAVRTRQVFGDVLYNFYGSTEVAIATVATPTDLRVAPGTVGRSPRNCTVRLFDTTDQPVKNPNEVGRVFVGSKLKFGGYTNGSGIQQIGGLAETGDLGHFDTHGLLFIDGRQDDMIVSGGENVFPGEVQNLLLSHYQIRDAAVVGVPDDDFGQRLRAYVVPVRGANIASAEIKEFVRASLARHKVPRDVVVLARLPRTATGKVIGHLLTSAQRTTPPERWASRHHERFSSDIR